MNEKIFYKFKNINEYTYDSLKEKYFYFSTPKELNDSQDCRIPIDYQTDPKNILRWIKNAKKLGRKDGKNPELFPFNTVDKVRKAISKDGKLKEIFEHTILDTIGYFHLLSLTDSFNNEKMWDSKDYCSDFSGICIGYKAYQLQYPKFDSYFIQTIDNNENRKPYFVNYGSKKFFVLKEIEYDNDRKHCYNPFEETYDKNFMLVVDAQNKNKDNTAYNLFHKTQRWCEESEFRGFYISFSNDNSKVIYPDEILESITFGYKVTENRIAKIKKIIKNNYSNSEKIKYYIASPNTNHGINRRPSV